MNAIDYFNPANKFNQDALLDLQKRYPDMTMEKYMAERSETIKKLRRKMIDAGSAAYIVMTEFQIFCTVMEAMKELKQEGKKK